MLTQDIILKTLREQKTYFTTELGVKRIGLFGSYAKGTQKESSDVDVLIEMPPNWDNLCEVWEILEDEWKVKVDLVRVGKHLGESFLKDVREEIIYA